MAKIEIYDTVPRWTVERVSYGTHFALLEKGYEPFAVAESSTGRYIYLRKQIQVRATISVTDERGGEHG